MCLLGNTPSAPSVCLSRIKMTPRVLAIIEAGNLLVAIVSLEDSMRSKSDTRIGHSG